MAGSPKASTLLTSRRRRRCWRNWRDVQHTLDTDLSDARPVPSAMPISPQHMQTVRLVLSEIRIFREQGQMLTDGLPDQHAVKRVLVLESRQLIESSGVLRRQSKESKAHLYCGIWQFFRGGTLKFDFPKGEFEGDLPKRHNAHMDVVCCIKDSSSGTMAQLLRVHGSPEKRMRIQQAIHAVKNASSVILKSSCIS